MLHYIKGDHLTLMLVIWVCDQSIELIELARISDFSSDSRDNCVVQGYGKEGFRCFPLIGMSHGCVEACEEGMAHRHSGYRQMVKHDKDMYQLSRRFG